jgi:hypothetical protein
MSRRVATARLGRVLHLAADALLPVEGAEVRDGRRVVGVGRWAHSRGCGALGKCVRSRLSPFRALRGVVGEDACVPTWVAAGTGGV